MLGCRVQMLAEYSSSIKIFTLVDFGLKIYGHSRYIVSPLLLQLISVMMGPSPYMPLLLKFLAKNHPCHNQESYDWQ